MSNKDIETNINENTEKSETPQDIVSAIFMILTPIRIWLQMMNLRNLISTLL